jgi:hypothetical protein
MTLPNEEMRSVGYAYDFLMRLLDPSKMKGVPKDIRREALDILHHYPSPYRLPVIFKAELEKQEEMLSGYGKKKNRKI